MKIRYMLIGLIATLLVGGLISSYYFGSCPLDYEESGICTGPCTAFIDNNNDGICDRSQNTLAEAATATRLAVTPTAPDTPSVPTATSTVANTPAAGETVAPTAEATKTTVPATPTPTPKPETDCPFGLVNDPYPGECGRYVDQNENGICDHSEP
ncbi:MAG: hypothetical protein U9Q70_03890 [Chloroflexota bacterium]|nr:hypothetical protein [Chloroflexota bacterium]